MADGKPGELVTWTPEPETGTIPRHVADGLDAVVTLGGDGTVLWTCSILGNGSVPPLVPFAMGSLGFMTPFAMEKMTKTLEQVPLFALFMLQSWLLLRLNLGHHFLNAHMCLLLQSPQHTHPVHVRFDCREMDIVRSKQAMSWSSLAVYQINLACAA